jgi:hypothetical protein
MVSAMLLSDPPKEALDFLASPPSFASSRAAFPPPFTRNEDAHPRMLLPVLRRLVLGLNAEGETEGRRSAARSTA